MVRVGVIGAGAAGITTAKQAVDLGFDVIVFEQMREVGGTWIYDPEVTTHSAMYEVLKTNLPREIMNFHDKEISTNLPSFVGHKEILDYLKDYSKDLPIKFNHRVESAKRVGNFWNVVVSHEGKTELHEFDVLFVCNGHFFSPRITFATEKFKGRVVHSKDYRRARDFTGEKVVVVGAGPSGIDIALQLCDTATEVHLVGRFADYFGVPENLKQKIAKITEASDNHVVLSDGSTIDDVTTIIACTGYEMKFPFLSDDLVHVSHDGQMVSPLWNHVVHVKYPTSLFFIGISLVAITLPLFEYQAKMALAFVSGAAPLPSEAELTNFEEEALKQLAELGMDGRSYHSLKDSQWDYLESMAKYGKFEHIQPLPFVKGIYQHVFNTRKNVTTYKKINFIVDEQKKNFQIVPL